MRLPLYGSLDRENVVGEADTESREVSSLALFPFTQGIYGVGSPVEIVMILPHELTQAGPGARSLSGTRPAHSQENSGEMGVAAAIERYEFMRSG